LATGLPWDSASGIVASVAALLLGIYFFVDGLPRAWQRRRFESVAAGFAEGKAVTSPNRAVLAKVRRRLVMGLPFGAVSLLFNYWTHGFWWMALFTAAIPTLQYLTSGDQDSELAAGLSDD
jgi:hypothetical protein